jgi:transcriptional antiterminator NusG
MADDKSEDELESPASSDMVEAGDPLEEDAGVSLEEIHAEPSDGVHNEAAETAPAPTLSDTDKHWYIIHAYSGFEQKVAESLRTRSQAFGFADRLGQILIPTEEVIELRNGKKVTSKRLLYPGYVLVEMEMDDEFWVAV